MTESIFARIKRLVSGSVEDMVDSMERNGGSTVMREAIREIDRVEEDVKNNRDEATARRLQAVRQQQLYREKLDDLQEKAQFAMDEGREDLAEAALHRQMDFEAQIKRLEEVEANAAEMERQFEESLASLEMRKALLQEELEHFEAARMEAGIAEDHSGASGRDKMRRVERAEAAFARAMNGTGNQNMAADAQNASKVAEIDAMQRQEEIHQRMEQMRQRKAG
ncbi:MAG: PspA/IM30 family protein [Pseudomonadota bacterium]